jgi:predicted enzyme related to lactoylglutathione lyase
MTQIYSPGTPSWVDLGTTDVTAAAAFYGGLFGWTLDDLGPEGGGYGIFRKDGKQVAGIGPATDEARGTSWTTYFATDDVDETASRVAAGGGQVIMAPMDVMDQGRMAVFVDPAGAFFSAWQAGKHIGAELVNEPGSFTWNELVSSDIDTCKSFYAQVFGGTTRDVNMGEGPAYVLFQVNDRPVAGGMAYDPTMGPLPGGWSVYFSVADCDSSHAKAGELGAATVLAPMDSPAGRFAIMRDPQGGTFAIIKNDPNFTI